MLKDQMERFITWVGEGLAGLSLNRCCFLAAYEPEMPEELEEMFESEEE